jgi:hypothetical protein
MIVMRFYRKIDLDGGMELHRMKSLRKALFHIAPFLIMEWNVKIQNVKKDFEALLASELRMERLKMKRNTFSPN